MMPKFAPDSETHIQSHQESCKRALSDIIPIFGAGCSAQHGVRPPGDLGIIHSDLTHSSVLSIYTAILLLSLINQATLTYYTSMLMYFRAVLCHSS